MLISKANLKHGSLEFNQMQELIKDELLNVIGSLIKQYGIIRNSIVGLDKFLVAQTGSLTVSIKAGTAILQDSDGNPAVAVLANDYSLPLTNQNVTYKIAIRHKTHNLEDGLINTTVGDNTIIAVGTEFTKIFAENRSIIIENNIYPISSVTSDTSLELVDPYPNMSETGINFSVGGYFTSPLTNAADSLIYEHDGIEIIATTDALQSDEYLLANVTVASGSITSVTDMRDAITLQMNLYAPASIWIPHTFTIYNEVKLPSSTIHYVLPFFIGKPAGQSVQIVKCIHKIQSGTSATVKITQNGSDLALLSNITVTQTLTSLVPASSILLNDGDTIDMVVTGVSGTPMNLSFTLLIQYSI